MTFIFIYVVTRTNSLIPLYSFAFCLVSFHFNLKDILQHILQDHWQKTLLLFIWECINFSSDSIHFSSFIFLLKLKLVTFNCGIFEFNFFFDFSILLLSPSMNFSFQLLYTSYQHRVQKSGRGITFECFQVSSELMYPVLGTHVVL